eukprot:979797-Prorocentrum_minimum.AAC.1
MEDSTTNDGRAELGDAADGREEVSNAVDGREEVSNAVGRRVEVNNAVELREEYDNAVDDREEDSSVEGVFVESQVLLAREDGEKKRSFSRRYTRFVFVYR